MFTQRLDLPVSAKECTDSLNSLCFPRSAQEHLANRRLYIFGTLSIRAQFYCKINIYTEVLCRHGGLYVRLPTEH